MKQYWCTLLLFCLFFSVQSQVDILLLPSEQEKAVTAQRAPVGLKKPLESRLNGVSCISPSKIDGPAMRTARGEQPKFGVHH